MTLTADRPGTNATSTAGRHLAARVTGAALTLGVAAIHIKDQGGFPGDKSPTYVGIGYYVLEAAGVIAALALLFGSVRRITTAWALAVAVAIAPLVGYVLSRGPGLPDYTDDKGNWTETLGLLSLVVEGSLLLLSLAMLARSRRRFV